MQKNIVETILGAVVLVVAGIFLFFAYNAADLRAVDGYRITADFSSTDGLRVGEDVRISGVKVGSVVDMGLNPDNYYATVGMTIRHDIKLPLDTIAIISSESLMGGKFISLEPGVEDEFLETGGIIEITQSTPSLEKLIGQAIYSMGDDKNK